MVSDCGSPSGDRGGEDEESNGPPASSGASTYRWPRKSSKRFATLVLLLNGLRASHLDVWAAANTYRGAAVVLALKGSGFPIVTELQPHRTANGQATRIAYYSIPAAALGDVLTDGHRKGVI